MSLGFILTRDSTVKVSQALTTQIVIIASKFGYGTLMKNAYSTITMKWFVSRLSTKNGTTRPPLALLRLKTRRQRPPTRSRAVWRLKVSEYACGGMVLNGIIRGVQGVQFIYDIISVFPKKKI